MTTFPITVRVSDNQGSYADQDFTIDVTNDKVDNFIVVADNGLARSKDGLNWTIQPGYGYAGIAVAYGNGLWTKVRSLNPMIVDWSYDGVEWNTYDATVMINAPTAIAILANIQYDAPSSKWYIFGLDLSYSTIYIYTTSDWITFQTVHNAAYGANFTHWFSRDLIIDGSTILTAFGGFAPNHTYYYVLVSKDTGATWQLNRIRDAFQSSGGTGVSVTSIKKIQDKYYIGSVASGYFGYATLSSYDGLNWNEEVVGNANEAQFIVGDVNGALHTLRAYGGNYVPTYYNPVNYKGQAPAAPIGVIPPGWSLGSSFPPGVIGPSYSGLPNVACAVFNDRYVYIACGDFTNTATLPGYITCVIAGDDPFVQATYNDNARPAFSSIISSGAIAFNGVTYTALCDIAARV